MRKILVPFLFSLCAVSVSAQRDLQFRDITQQAGIHFVHNNGAFGKKYLPETMGSGCAFIDYDNDGWPDILMVNSKDWPGHKRTDSTLKLYHNNHDGTFADVTRKAGLTISMYGMGVSIGDYSMMDMTTSLSALLARAICSTTMATGRLRMSRKPRGCGSRMSSPPAPPGWITIATASWIWSSRITFSGPRRATCTARSTARANLTALPNRIKGSSARLWHNLGNGKFEDVTQKAKFYDATSKSLGVAIVDYNGDGWPDILLTNDTQPNKLYANKHDGTFEEKGVSAGIAFSEDGVARAGMGVDVADYDRSGRPSFIITNFANQMLSLYHNEGNGLFVDDAPQSEVGRATW